MTPSSPEIRLGPTAAVLRRAYDHMRAAQGHQHWWPGRTPFEVCVGAILTQNTSWKNVERAIRRLDQAGALDPQVLHATPHATLAEWVRPAGYFNVKARRLAAFVATLVNDHQGSLAQLFAGETSVVRERLLAIHGIGPETADCLLLYAGGHLSFVVDAYTRRIFARHGWCGPAATYDDLQVRCARSRDASKGLDLLDYWQDYHAQLVAVGKDFCRPREPRCTTCPLRSLLPDQNSNQMT